MPFNDKYPRQHGEASIMKLDPVDLEKTDHIFMELFAIYGKKFIKDKKKTSRK